MPATLVDKADFYVIRRPFNANGVDLEPGEIVTIDGWVNAQPLISTRRMAIFPNSQLDSTVTCECGRCWENDLRCAAHRCPARPPVETPDVADLGTAVAQPDDFTDAPVLNPGERQRTTRPTSHSRAKEN